MKSEKYEFSRVKWNIGDAFFEMADKGRIKSHSRIVERFVADAASMLIGEYCFDDTCKRLENYLNKKYGDNWGLISLTDRRVEWDELMEKDKNRREEVIKKVSDEKRKQWKNEIISFYETQLFKKMSETVIIQKEPFYNKFEEMFLELFYEIKKDIRPLVSQMDFSCEENYVTAIVSSL